MNRQKRAHLYYRIVSVILAMLLVIPTMSFGVYAATEPARDGAADEAAIGHVGARTTAEPQGDLYDRSYQVTFKDEYFQQSSYVDNIHLAKLSAQAALASTRYYDLKKDPWRKDPSLSAKDIMSLLTDEGFRDVKANQYYPLEDLENSMGVVVGQKTIQQGGKPYTMLAVMFRGNGYKQEWAGNFEIGSGNINAGIKAARDEALRFVKQYIEENQITGDLKFWIAGHSRGAATGNMVGGFLAGGGAPYLGGQVSIRPQDIYCYCFASPVVIRKGTLKSEELSVAGYRGGRYEKDTPGEPFVYEGAGTLDPKADIYQGIKGYINGGDLVPKVPPVQWEMTCYGTEQSVTGSATWDEMMVQLKVVEPNLYDEFTAGNPANFAYYTFDLASMQVARDENRPGGSLQEFLDARAATLGEVIPTNQYYAAESDYQDALAATASAVGMLVTSNEKYIFGGQDFDTAALIRPLVLSYLAYATERIIAEGRAQSEAEALGVWLGEFAGYISGLEVPANPTADFIFYAFTEFIAKNPDSETTNQIVGQMKDSVPKTVLSVLKANFVPKDKKKNISDEDIIKTSLIACARGTESGATLKKNAEQVRQMVYTTVAPVLKSNPQMFASMGTGDGSIEDILMSVLGTVVEMTVKSKGTSSLTEVAAAILPILTTGTGGANRTLGEAADAELADVLTNILYPAAKRAGKIYGSEYQADVERHLQVMLNDITSVRRVLSYFLFCTPGANYSTADAISNACTMVKNINMIRPGHYCEGYISWLAARIAKGEGALTIVVKKAQNPQVTAKKKTFKVKAAKLKKKNVTLSAITVKNAQGKVSYKKVSGNSHISVNAGNGKVTIKKKTKKGNYKVKVAVTAAGNKDYKPATKTVTLKIKVK